MGNERIRCFGVVEVGIAARSRIGLGGMQLDFLLLAQSVRTSKAVAATPPPTAALAGSRTCSLGDGEDRWHMPDSQGSWWSNVRYQRVIYLVAGLLIGVVAAWVAMSSIRKAPTALSPGGAASLAYTKSLILFVIPVVAMALWFLWPGHRVNRHWWPFWATVVGITILWTALDILLAHTFFTFPDTDAVSGIGIPGLGGKVPIEEVLFYVLGSFFLVLTYIWTSEVWFPDRDQADAEYDRRWPGMLKLDQGEALPPVSGGVGDVHGEQNDEQHLGKRVETSADVGTAVQIVQECAVDPCQPDQAEDHRELGSGPESDIVGHGAGGGGDHDDIDEVVEQFEEADRPILDDVAVSTRWLPEPASEVSQHRGRNIARSICEIPLDLKLA